MIIDTLENITMYAPLLCGIHQALTALDEYRGAPVGRYEFEGGYLLIQEGTTKPMSDGTFEVHRHYIDVQVLLEGEEEISWEKKEALTTVLAYDESTDKERLTGEDTHIMRITEGMVWCAFPDDGHKAVCHTDKVHQYRKAVIKLPVKEA